MDRGQEAVANGVSWIQREPGQCGVACNWTGFRGDESTLRACFLCEEWGWGAGASYTVGSPELSDGHRKQAAFLSSCAPG